jgi:hypothetical protein
MRFWLSLLVLAPAVLAQAPAEEHNYWHFQPPPAKKFFVGNPTPKPLVIPRDTLRATPPPKSCSVPLTNVLKNKLSGKFHMRKIPVDPFANEHFRMTTVTPPAPPCDDEKR